MYRPMIYINNMSIMRKHYKITGSSITITQYNDN